MNSTKGASIKSTPSKKDQPERNKRHYATQLITLQVENQLFRIPTDILRGSAYFREMLDADQFGEPGEGSSDQQPIILSGIKAKDMEGFLDMPHSRLTNKSGSKSFLSFSQLSAALHLATMWSFDHVREYAIFQIDQRFPNPAARIDLSLKYDVKKWRLPAYRELCERAESLDGAEMTCLGALRSAAICRIREKRLRGEIERDDCGTCEDCTNGFFDSDCTRKIPKMASLIKAERDLD